MKNKMLSYLLIGLLSMLYAEIFSGASQLWFINPWGIFYTLPLYMFHTLFLLAIAIKFKRTSIRHLYWLGVIFGLYEAIITKVLWQGYMNETKPALGTIFGVATIEFPILVFFWHPIFSFILPILTYEILSQHILIEHSNLLSKSKKKNILIIIVLLTISTFILNGSKLDLILAILSLLGTVFLILIVYRLLHQKMISIESFSHVNLFLVSIILIGIYVFGGIILLPERFPTTIMPYITIIFFYILAISMFLIPTSLNNKMDKTNQFYSRKHLLYALIILIAFMIGIYFVWNIGEVILTVSYLLFTQIGLIFIIVDVYKHTRKLIIYKKTKSLD